MAEKKTATKSSTARDKKSAGFTDDERAAMKERAKELKAEARQGLAWEQGGRRERLARQGCRDARTGPNDG